MSANRVAREHSLRRWLLVLLAIGLIGTAVDLVLLDHYEDAWQMPPLVLTSGSLAIVLWVGLRGGPAAITTLRIAMVLCVASGLLGLARTSGATGKNQSQCK